MHKAQSIALESGGRHLLSDFLTTAAVVLGLLLVRFTGLLWIDSAVAILIGFHLAWTGLSLVRNSIGGLMDEEDPELIRDLADVCRNNLFPGIIQIHHAKIIRSGRYHHIDAHIVVPEFWQIEHAHDQTVIFERGVLRDYKFTGEINFHLDPCRRAYCRHCDLPECPVRQEEFVMRLPVKLKDFRNPEEPLL